MDDIWQNANLGEEAGKGPLHLKLRESIRAQILSGALELGDMLPPEIELARVYGVSRTTIRRALLDLTQEGLLFRVPGQGTKVQKRRPATMKAVALVCPFMHWYMMDVIEGIESVVKTEGYELVVRNSGRDVQIEANQIEELNSMSVAGLVLWPKTPEFDTAPSSTVRDLVRSGTPLVVIDQYAPPADTVTTDNFGGAYMMGQHLMQRGLKRIGFLTEHKAMPSTVQARWDGLQEALRNQELPCDDNLLFQRWGDHRAFGDWFSRESPQALFCANDFIALEVINALARMGIGVPNDVAVVGYDDVPLAAILHPPLTTIRQDFRAVGQSAGRLLLRRIPETSLPPRHIVLPVQLQVRSSCGTLVPMETPAL